MIISAKPIGVLDSGDTLPGFRQIVCENQDGLVTPLVDSNTNLIVGFEQATDIGRAEIIEADISSRRLEIGQPTLYAYKFPQRPAIARDRVGMSLEVSKGFGRLSGFPFARLEAAAFLHNAGLVRRYAREATTAYILSNKSASIKDVQRIISHFLPKGDSLDQVYLNEFCRGMLKFYKLYHLLLHTSDLDTRKKYRRRFDVSARFIMPFLLDSNFLFRIESEALYNMDLTPNFEFGTEGAIGAATILAQFGVSRNNAARFLAYADRKSDNQLELPLFKHSQDDENFTEHEAFSRAGLIVPLTYRAISARHELTDAINRMDKKLKKRRADFSFASLAYGLLLVVQAETGGAYVSRSARNFGLQAIRKGIGELTYSG